MTDDQSAYVLRIAPGGADMVSSCIEHDEILIGWQDAKGLINRDLSWQQFRDIVSHAHYPNEMNLRRAGSAAGQLWRFLRDMKVGDLVVVPHPGVFYVAEVLGEPACGNADHNFYFRSVRWLNNKQPIPRKMARAALQSRMKIQGTCADADDLVGAIQECVGFAKSGEEPTFQQDLHARLINQTIAEIRGGRLDSYGFESLIQEVMMGLGATQCPIIARSIDYGADLVATFLMAGVFELRVAIQAKHYYRTEVPLGAEVVAEVIRGIEEENANLGMIITAGKLSEHATDAAREYFEKSGIKIELIDGEQFAALIVERGLGVHHRQKAGT